MRNVSSETFCSLAAGGGAGWQRRDTFYYARQGRRVGAGPSTGDSVDAAIVIPDNYLEATLSIVIRFLWGEFRRESLLID